MRVLVFWDIYGRIGRKAFIKEFEKIKKKFSADFTIANIENITSGKWPIREHAELIASLWVDMMTGWDHVFDNMESISEYFEREDCRLIRPANFYGDNLPGKGSMIIEKDGKKLLVIQILWEAFISHNVENPFLSVEEEIKNHWSEVFDAVIVDFHRETTAELYGMANYLDGKASLVYGTHTHIQTNDAHILKWWTAMICDVGMNGPFDSVIGADYNSVKKRFLSGIQRWKIEQALWNEFVINAIFVEIDEISSRATHIENISYRWQL